ncbi:YybH family protein [Robertkochia aurantiaca]|uniref:YybH family protein n=1 Tax=Robertkochia aurantiaca TaxID=2873700 RepID=UPI001CCFF51E|nr:nuclear transport factor 2 family protein [Robertkochia sp. 3YJGBD-33]
MKKATLLILTLFFTAVAVNAQQSITRSDREAIMEILGNQQKAWNKGDIPEFMEGYWKSDSLSFTGSGGPVFGWQNTKDRYLRNYPDTTAMGKLGFTVIRLQQVAPSVAQMIGKFELSRSIGDLSGYFTLVWRKFGDEWVIISDHTSAAAP